MIQRFYVESFRCLENFELPSSGIAPALLNGGNGTTGDRGTLLRPGRGDRFGAGIKKWDDGGPGDIATGDRGTLLNVLERITSALRTPLFETSSY